MVSLRRVLTDIDRKLDQIMGDTTALTAAVANLQTEDSDLLAAINATLTDLAAEVAFALQAAQGALATRPPLTPRRRPLPRR